ncbi:MAG: photosystem II complex extrinsic protein PsbU [Cyanobacteria bacterium J06555_13]
MFRVFFNLFLGLVLVVGSWAIPVTSEAANASLITKYSTENIPISAEEYRNPVEEKFREVGDKVDLNNSSVLAFRRYRGLYPTLARKVIENAPYDTVEEVLTIPELSDRERDVLKSNLDNFVVTEPEPALIEGGDRINPGIYK